MKDRQVSFSAGELAPGLWGRTDLSRYRVGAKTLKNFLIAANGTLINRAGTQRVASISANGDKARLVPFVVDETESYVLVFVEDNRSVRIYRESTTDPRHSFSYVALVTWPWSHDEDELATIQWAQAGDYLTICADGKNPAEVRFVSESVWQMEELDFTAPVYEELDDVGDDFHYTEFEPRVAYYNDIEKAVAELYDSSFPPREWSWALTNVIRGAKDGKLYETQPYVLDKLHVAKDDLGAGTNPVPYYVANLGRNHAVYATRPRTIWTGRLPGYAFQNGDTLHSSRLYRGRDGQFGFIAETKSRLVDDNGAEPFYSDPPPSSENPIDGEHPRVPFFFESRRGLAASTARPDTVWESSVELFDNFDEVSIPDDADSLEFTIVGKARQIVRWVIDLGAMLVGCSGGVYLAQGSGDSTVVTPNSIWVHSVSSQGVGSLRPVEAGDAAFYVETKGSSPYAIQKNDSGKSFTFQDISILSSHLFDGYTIVGWAWSHGPHRTLWVARSDGKLLSFGFVPELEIMAWATHELAGGGLVEDVLTKPESTEDAVYLVVNHGGIRSLERMAYRLFPLNVLGKPDIRYCIFLDRSKTYNGFNTTPLIFASDGDVGDEISVLTAHGLAVAEVVRVDDPAGAESYFFQVVSDDGGGYFTLQVTTRDFERADFTDNRTAKWWLCATSVSGLHYLEGQTVTLVADGDVWEGIVVDGGGADLGEGNHAGLIHVGLPYVSDFVGLDVAQKDGRQKLVRRATLELEHTRGGEIGADLDSLVEIPARAVEDGYLPIPLFRREEVEPVADEWDTTASVAVRQSAPMPMTILGILRDYVTGGD